MHSKIIAANASSILRRSHIYRNRVARQYGVTLIELMVGLALGLLVIAVAVGALLVSRGISSTVSDASGIQQQAAFAMRVIGQQLRQAGSLYLNPDPTSSAATSPLSAVVFETDATGASGANSFLQDNTLAASSATAMSVNYRRYKDSVFTSSSDISLVRNCVGGPADSSADQALESAFQLVGSELRCGGNSTTAQAIVQNVAEFQVRYIEQTVDATGTAIQYRAFDQVAQWRSVQGVEVCLVLYGTDVTDMPSGSSYTDCSGTAVDMTTLTGDRLKRMHRLFRNVFQVRSQGLL